METAVAGVKLVGPDNGREGFLGSIGVRFLIDGPEASERFSDSGFTSLERSRGRLLGSRERLLRYFWPPDD